MDFNYTQEQENFRQRVCVFVKDNLPKNAGRAGSPQSGAQADHQFLREWQRKGIIRVDDNAIVIDEPDQQLTGAPHR